MATAGLNMSASPPSPSPSPSPPPTGPKAQGRRQPSRRGGRDSSSPRPSRPRRERPQQEQIFNAKATTSAQNSNQESPPLFDLESALREEDGIQSLSGSPQFQQPLQQPPFTFLGLDDLFPGIGFSNTFNTDGEFRIQLRAAIRKDIFETTPFYANLSEKAMACLMLPDSSLEGSWRIPEDNKEIRMKYTTKVLQDALGEKAPTGDDLVLAIGNLCGSTPSTHWIDIYGVQDRKINHSWHLDFGKSQSITSRTVLLGFPPENNYKGCGVFSHLIALKNECMTPIDHPATMEPVLFAGTVDENYIVRPKYEPGKELIMYRDIDVLHSAPDVTYRTSIMRFM